MTSTTTGSRVGGGDHAVIPGEVQIIRAHIGRGVVDRDLVGYTRTQAAVEPRQVAEVMQTGTPCADERLHRRTATGVIRPVRLHIVDQHAAAGEAECGRLCDGILGVRASLGRSIGRGEQELLVRGRTRRLQAHVDRHQVPAVSDLFGDPIGSQVRLRAGPVDTAEVDSDRAVRRRQPRGHRCTRRCSAGVEAEPGVGPRRHRRYGRGGVTRSRGYRRCQHRGQERDRNAREHLRAASRSRCRHRACHVDPRPTIATCHRMRSRGRSASCF